MIRFVLLAALACITVAEPSGYAYSRAAPNNGLESSVNKNNAVRQLAVNSVANHVGSGSGTARKDGVAGTPLGVTGHDRYSYVHGHGHGGYGQGNRGYAGYSRGGYGNGGYGNGNKGYGNAAQGIGYGYNNGFTQTGNYGYAGLGNAGQGYTGYGVIGHNAGYGHHAGNAGHRGFSHGHSRAY